MEKKGNYYLIVGYILGLDGIQSAGSKVALIFVFRLYDNFVEVRTTTESFLPESIDQSFPGKPNTTTKYSWDS